MSGYNEGTEWDKSLDGLISPESLSFESCVRIANENGDLRVKVDFLTDKVNYLKHQVEIREERAFKTSVQAFVESVESSDTNIQTVITMGSWVHPFNHNIAGHALYGLIKRLPYMTFTRSVGVSDVAYVLIAFKYAFNDRFGKHATTTLVLFEAEQYQTKINGGPRWFGFPQGFLKNYRTLHDLVLFGSVALTRELNDKLKTRYEIEEEEDILIWPGLVQHETPEIAIDRLFDELHKRKWFTGNTVAAHTTTGTTPQVEEVRLTTTKPLYEVKM